MYMATLDNNLNPTEQVTNVNVMSIYVEFYVKNMDFNLQNETPQVVFVMS